MKAAIEREQCQTCLSIAEREQARPQVKNEEFAAAVLANRSTVNQLINSKTYDMKKETWKFVIQTILAVLTAIATSFGVTSCIN